MNKKQLIVAWVVLIMFFSCVNFSFAEIGRSIVEFETSKFISVYKPNEKRNRILSTGNKAYLYKFTGIYTPASIEIVLGKDDRIEKQTFLSGFYNAPSAALLSMMLAFVYESSGGKINLDDFNSALAAAKGEGEVLSGFNVKITFMPEIEGVKMIVVTISQ